MRKKRLFMLPCIAAVVIAVVGGTKAFRSNAYETSSLLMQNVEALSMGEETTCPNPYDVPDRYIVATTTTTTGTSNLKGQITVSTGNTYSGDFEKGKTYTVVITTKNCDGVQTGACCPQKEVGTTVKKK